ncbi:hypothetical protein RDI58_029403 [Solanum bulbocastanum]|uniref:Uncharacterized protein n=1 Tax=Solanum bulbocastanum TaxID=147425 RepID=A0AAN8SQB1_SOLBU
MTIYDKFDFGYLGSVKVGSEVLNGVIYHPKEQTHLAMTLYLTIHHLTTIQDGRERGGGGRRETLISPNLDGMTTTSSMLKKSHPQVSLSKETLGIHKDDCKILEQSSA